MANQALQQGQETASLRQQQGNYPDIIPYFIFNYFENIGIEDGTYKVGTRDVSGDGAWGKGFANSTHTANNLTWGQTGAIWQSTYTSAVVYSAVYNPTGIFAEHFVDSDYIDTGSSTATISLGTSGSISFTTGQILQSGVIHSDGTTISKATLSLNTAVLTGTLTYYLSADGGSHWEAVTNDQTYSFAYLGTSLKYKLVASGSVTLSTAYNTNNRILEVKING